MKATRYRSYSNEIKSQIILSGNPRLYPELKIPLNTAKYWIDQSKKPKPKVEKKFQYRAIRQLKEEIIKERAKTDLLMNLRDHIHLFGSSKRIPHADIRFILKQLGTARKSMTLKLALELIGMSHSQYKRWTQKKMSCENSYINKCYKSHPNQLTRKEIEKIKELCLRRKFKHMSFTALHKLSLRNGWIHCSRETWFKYIRLLKISNISRKVKKKKKCLGVRASKPNKIWHIDITELRTSSNKKLYLQAIMDNFSRKIISWTLYTKKSGDITVLSLQKIRNLHKQKEILLFCDQGGENKSSKLKVILGHNIKRIYAQVDTHFSNSMIEAFFRSLKNNFLNKIKLRDYEHARKKINYYIRQHNFVIPHSAFSFETPNEVHHNRHPETANKGDVNAKDKASLCQKCIQ